MTRCPRCHYEFEPAADRFREAPERDRDAEVKKRTRHRALDVSLLPSEDGQSPQIRFERPRPPDDQSDLS